MASEILFFKGITKWAKVRKPDPKYERYEVPLYMDKAELKRFKDAKLALTLKEDEDGDFAIFKRKHAEFDNLKKEQVINGPPKLTFKGKDGKYVDWPEGLIGNGSEVTVKVEVFDTKHGNKGHRLLAVGVDKLVEYVPKKAEDDPSFPF